ncbi:MAG: hypothetical protein ABS44_11660 [Chryseobacterium sp. SCN 40-13]|nr:MAG: hypothetical protein ABS44_11660 [Chryseobacterium sp. SCN 40-13]
MTEQQTFDIEKLEATHLPELQGLKEKQLQIVRENPFVKVEDATTYEAAKKARTTLVSARTDIEKQDKLIASKIKKFREAVAKASQELIAITKPHEDKQQDEVRRYEAIKEAEKAEKAKQEEERKNKIKNAIDQIISTALGKIHNLSFEMIDTLKVDFEENLYKTDLSQFEEFELDFNEKLIQVKSVLHFKIQQLQLDENQRLEQVRLQEEADKIAAERAELKKQRDEIEAEKARLTKLEADRKAKEETERLEAERKEREDREKAEKEAKAKADAEREEALRPDMEKIIMYLLSIKASSPEPELKDPKISTEFENVKERINDAISDAISVIKNFK